MTTISVEEIKKDVAGYLKHVEQGEAFIITHANQPLAEVKPIVMPSKVLRPVGLAAGQFVMPDDFDAPLPDDVQKEFEGRWLRYETPIRRR